MTCYTLPLRGKSPKSLLAMIWAFNGFWGDARDWDFCREKFYENLTVRIHVVPDLLKVAGNPQAFIDFVKDQDPHPLFMGYSMGARLGLSKFLLREDNPFKAAILMAPHLGLSQQQAWARVEEDEKLAQKFSNSAYSWQSLHEDWNSRDLFGGFKKELSPEKPHDRRKLSRELRELGLGRQEPLETQLHLLSIPILWFVGEKDQKFKAELCKALQQSQKIQAFEIPGGFHRAHWENPQAFINRSLSFLSEHFKCKS